jgi:hypothetical protein
MIPAVITLMMFYASHPKLMDPFERRTIFIRNSTIPGMTCGDGLFAKKNIPGSHEILYPIYIITVLLLL